MGNFKSLEKIRNPRSKQESIARRLLKHTEIKDDWFLVNGTELNSMKEAIRRNYINKIQNEVKSK